MMRSITSTFIALFALFTAGNCFSAEAPGDSASGKMQWYRPRNAQPPIPPAVRPLVTDGIALMNASKWQEAAAKFDAALKEAPDLPSVHQNRGACYKALGKLDLAVADYTKAMQLAPEMRELLLLDRGRMLVDLGDIDAAERDFNKAKDIPAVRAQSYSELAYIAVGRKDFPACIALASRAIQADRKFADGWVNRGACEITSAKYAEAVKDLSEAIRLAPNFTPAYMNRAAVYVALKNCKAAQSDANTVARLDPGHAEKARRLAASCK